jgi:hypothetical protein
MRTRHPDLIPYVRGYGTARDYLEALVIERSAAGAQLAHIRQTKAQWAEADGGAAAVDALFTRFENGDLQLKDTTNTLFTRTNHPNNQTDLGGDFPLEAAHLQWEGPEPNDFEMLRAKFWLNPRVNGSQKREVFLWRLEIYALMMASGFDTGTDPHSGFYAPIAEPLDVLVTGDAAGEVTFDYSSRAERPQPKRIQPTILQSSVFTIPATHRPPTSLFIVRALNASGGTASNVALGVNDAETVFTTGGQTLRRIRFSQNSSRGWLDANAGLGVPHLVIENGTYTAATITFSSGNLFDLGATPTTDVELVGIIQTPPGTSVTLEVRNAADSGWTPFTNGQFENADLLMALIQSKKMRATLTPNAAGNLTSMLRKFGRQAIRRIDFSRVATIEGYEQAFSPETHQVEIPRPRLVAVKDGPKSGPAAFSSKIEKLLAENFINDIRIRWHVGDRALTRDKWTHMDDFLVLDSRPRRPVIELQLVGLCALLKDLAPPFSPGTNYAPDGTQSIGSWTDLAGGTTNIHLAIDEPTADETDGIRSGLNPSNQEVIFTLPTPTDTAGRRLFVDCDYAKNASGGQTLELKIRIYQTGTLVAELVKPDIGPDRVQSTMELTEPQIAQLTDLPNVRVAFLANATGGAGDRRAHVYWARFRSGGRREVVSYTNQTLKAVYDDLFANRLAIPANLRGPGVENVIDTVSKQITGLRKRQPGSKDVVAKTELEAIAFIADRAIGSSAGRIKAFDLSPGQPIRAFFPSRRIAIGEASPGHARRIPEYFGGYRWDAAAEEFKDEVRAFHSNSILKIGTVGLGPPKWWDEEIGKWIDSDALAERLAKRVVDRIGTGEMLWSWDSVDRYPELEMGDIVAVETDLFVSRDPNLDIEVKGRRWAVGPLQRVGKGHFFTIHPRGYADILSSAQLASRVGFAPPVIRALQLHVDDGGNVSANISVSHGAAVRVAASIAGVPSDATTRAAALQLLDANGQLTTATLLSIIPTQIAYVKVFAYEGADGSGVESTAVTAATPKGTRKRNFIFDDGLYPLAASATDGLTASNNVKLVPTNGVLEGGVVQQIYRHREEITVMGPDTDGDVAVTFSQTYQNAPAILLRGGQMVSFSNVIGTSVKQRQRIQPINVTATGFTSRTQIASVGATTPQTDDFASGNLIDAVGETAEVNLDPAGANDDTYTVHYFVSVTLDAGSFGADLTLAIETNDGGGGGWIERATFHYSRSTTPGTTTWSHEQKPIIVTGLGTNDDIRLRAKAFTVASGTGSFIVRGGDAGGSNPETYNGVTYTTASDTVESAIPAAGDQVSWIAQEVT